MAIAKNGVLIDSLALWKKHAAPKGKNHWADGRSAKETAIAWLEVGGSRLPPEIEAALAAHNAFGPVIDWQAEPEAKLRFDDFRGEPRNSDMVVHATDAHGKYLIAVEAKTDEPFAATVADTLASSVERYLKNKASKGVARVEQLAAALFGVRGEGEPGLKDIRYQLLTACAGAICEADRNGYSRCLMLVQEFKTDKTTDEKYDKNAKDLNRFLKRLSHSAITGIKSGEICGPMTVPGKPLVSAEANIFIGKVSRDLRKT